MLTGLLPEPEVVRAFEKDPTHEAYARLVDRYLESPHFGERWARHWMDVVRFAETWGYEWNHLIRDAWRYRDYLIRAFNADVPFDQLIREHVAGDLLEEPRSNERLGLNESMIGTAFYRFGETGHDDCVLYPEISLDVMDNQIDTLTKAFQALTVSCSRCHDHKMDNIPQADYYALLGIMASSRQVIHTLDLPNRQKAAKARLRELKRSIRKELSALWHREIQAMTGEGLDRAAGEAAANVEHPLFAWQRLRGVSAGQWEEKWAQARATLQQEKDARSMWNREHYVTFADFGGKNDELLRDWGIEGLATEDGEAFLSDGAFSVLPDGEHVIVRLLQSGFYSHGLSQKLNAALRSPLLPEKWNFVSFHGMGERNSVCRTVIANCSLPYFHTHRFNSANLSWKTINLAHVRKSALLPFKSSLEWATVLDDQGYPVLNLPDAEYQKTLTDPRSYFGVTQVVFHDVSGPPRPELDAQARLFDLEPSGREQLLRGYRGLLERSRERWEKGEADSPDVFWLNAFIESGLLGRSLESSEALGKLTKKYRKIERALEEPRRIVGLADQDAGFDAPLLERGEAHSPGKKIDRKFLTSLEPLIRHKPEHRGSGRRRIAEMIASPENPLTARVFVNRLWHSLFGHGIVRSVDDFGKLGEPPSHPELLDYLARRFVGSGWSIKEMVREIVLSDAFRQSSRSTGLGVARDPENRLLHRYPSRRLEAEAIRDAMLQVSCSLDPTLFGPSIDPHRREVVDRRKLYSGPLDGKGRRSIYLKVTRMGASGLLELFNFPDPSMTRGNRDATNIPSQALGLLNHPFVRQQAERCAGGLNLGAADTFERRLERLFMVLFSRPPTKNEWTEYASYFKELEEAGGDSDPWRGIGAHAL